MKLMVIRCPIDITKGGPYIFAAMPERMTRKLCQDCNTFNSTESGRSCVECPALKQEETPRLRKLGLLPGLAL